jgi:hypothetical protein
VWVGVAGERHREVHRTGITEDFMFQTMFGFYSTVEIELKNFKYVNFVFSYENSGTRWKYGLRREKILTLETSTVVSKRDDLNLNLGSGNGKNGWIPEIFMS